MNEEEFLTTKEYPLRILFYPVSFTGDRINGIGIGDDIPTQSCVAPIADFYLLKFFTSDIFFFQMKFKQSNPLKKNKNNEYDTFAFVNGQFENYLSFDSEVFYEYIDEFSGKPNPLKHIITKSKKIKDREKKCIFLAMDFGFPLLYAVP
jgi:hypothetical protein